MTGAPWYSAYIIGFLAASVLWMAWAWWLLDQRAAARRDVEAELGRRQRRAGAERNRHHRRRNVVTTACQ